MQLCTADAIAWPASDTHKPAGRALEVHTKIHPSDTRGASHTSLPVCSPTHPILHTAARRLYKHITRLMAWAPCNAMGVEGNWAHPEGWDLLAMLGAREDLSAYGIASTSMPFAAVLRRSSNAQTRASCKAFVAAHPSMASASASSASSPRASARAARELCWGDELVVLVRGTASAFDWFYNLDYSMATNPYYGKGAMHLGFLRLAGGLWLGGLRDVMKQYGGTVSSVTIAGHSLGAATAALLASRTQVGLELVDVWGAWIAWDIVSRVCVCCCVITIGCQQFHLPSIANPSNTLTLVRLAVALLRLLFPPLLLRPSHITHRTGLPPTPPATRCAQLPRSRPCCLAHPTWATPPL